MLGNKNRVRVGFTLDLVRVRKKKKKKAERHIVISCFVTTESREFGPKWLQTCAGGFKQHVSALPAGCRTAQLGAASPPADGGHWATGVRGRPGSCLWPLPKPSVRGGAGAGPVSAQIGSFSHPGVRH